VRELANAIERAVVLGSDNEITALDLPSGLADGVAPTIEAQDLTYHDSINSARKQLVVNALSKTNGNRAAAARLLGLEAKYFLRLMKSLGIE
jgi:two-component system response regulator PilR (NtrC family)